MRGLTPDQINEAIQQRLTDAIRLQADALDSSVPAVLAGHVSLDRATTSSEQSMMLGRDHFLFYSSVALPAFEYVALGHIHRHQVIGHNPMAVYAGSLQRIDFGEEKDTKGFCVVDVNPGKMQGTRLEGFAFVPVEARRFLTIEVETRSGDDPTGKVLKAIEASEVDGAIVRVHIKVPAEMEAFLRDADIHRALAGAHHVASVSREVQREHRTRLGDAYSRGITPMEALQAYLDSRSTSPDRARTLSEYAQRLMEEE